MNCRFCNNKLENVFIDLNNAPPSNSYLKKEQLNEPEFYLPLKIFICEKCFLVQIDEIKKSTEIFAPDYKYFSSFSSTWLEHSKKYVDMITEKLNLNSKSLVTEIASNDGYLLQYFVEKKIPCLGIEPASDTAKVAIQKGIPVIEKFFDISLALTLEKSDLIIGNNVLAHVPNINNFVEGLSIALKPNGTITMEFPHILNLIKYNQFDTIYQEHYSYLSLFTVIEIFKKHNLKIYDVEEIDTHGGSLRIYATQIKNNVSITDNVKKLIKKEKQNNLHVLDGYLELQQNAFNIKVQFLDFLIQQAKENNLVVGYGAAAKGNTLLNFCGIKADLIEFVVDKSPHKQGHFLPGSHIPIVSLEEIEKNKPEYVIILPWNFKEEVVKELNFIKSWDGKFVTVIPELKIF